MNERYGILPKMTTVCDTNMTENDFALSSLFGFVDTLLGESGVQQMYDTWFSLDYLDEIDAESEPNLTQNVNIDITIEPTSIKSVENSQSRNDIVRHPVDSHNGKSWIRAPRIATANSGLSAQSPNNVNVQAGATRAGASRISERFTRPIMENLTRLYRFYNSITSESNKILQSLPEMKFNISNPKAVDNRNPSVTSNNNTPKINSTANGFELIERLIKHNRNHIEQFRFLEQLNYAKAGAAEKISKLENQTRDEKVRGQAFTSSQIDPKSDKISVKYIDYIRSSEYPTVRLENAVRQTAHLQNTPSHRSININNPTISGNTGNDKNEAKQGATPVRVQAVMVPFSTVRVAVTSPPKPLAVPVRVSVLAAALEAVVAEELPPQAARLKHSAPDRAMERIRFIMLKPHFLQCRAVRVNQTA